MLDLTIREWSSLLGVLAFMGVLWRTIGYFTVMTSLAAIFTAQGYAASTRDLPVGEQLCQQHCPVSHVAHEFPQLCEAETEAISRVLDTHVQRLATIAHGDGVCTTFVPTPVHTPSATDTSSPDSSSPVSGRNPV